MKIKVVIPARLASTRLAKKPLIDIEGKPMVVRTYERCIEAFSRDDVIVATDSPEIEEACARHGVPTVMTRDDHRTGTDRVAEYASLHPADVYINVQGDEPLFNPADLTRLLQAVEENPGMIINGYCDIHDEEEFNSRTTPKVVFDQAGFLLYMSRAGIPGGKTGEFKFGYRQVCAYAFPADAMRMFREHPGKTPLEAAEDIEIMRFIELGARVKMIRMSSQSIPVDVAEDLEKVNRALEGTTIDTLYADQSPTR